MIQTGDEPIDERLETYQLRVSNADRILMALIGGMLHAAYERQWEQWGTMTPFEAAQRIKATILSIERIDMIGMIAAFVVEPPEGWLILNGQTHQREDYPYLWDRLPNVWKSGSQFTLPDASGYVLRGASSAIGQTVGSNSIQLTVDQLPSHGHDTLPHEHNILGVVGATTIGLEAPQPVMVPSVTFTAPAGVDVLPTGNNQPIDITPASINVLWAIRAQ